MPHMNMRFPTVITLPWRTDAAEYWFSRLSHLPFAMLLHSGHADHPYSRFDILVADPLKTLTTDDLSLTDDPLAQLQHDINALGLSATPNPDLPFQGGALGLFGYDLGRRFETLPEHAQADISLPDMAVGLYDWALIVDHLKKTVSLLSHRDVQARLDWLEAQQAAPAETFTLTSGWRSNMSAAEYAEKFARVQAYLQSGDCYQVNLAQRFQATYRGDEWQAFTRLNASNKAPFSAFVRLDQGAILSLSPERFIHLAEGTIQTRPIKGTLPRLADPDADRQQAEKLAASPKDRAENLMIVDLMRNDIGRVAVPAASACRNCLSLNLSRRCIIWSAPLPRGCLTRARPATCCAPRSRVAPSPVRRRCGQWRSLMSWSPTGAMPGAAASAISACAARWIPALPSAR